LVLTLIFFLFFQQPLARRAGTTGDEKFLDGYFYEFMDDDLVG
jgi:hypothetical protein